MSAVPIRLAALAALVPLSLSPLPVASAAAHAAHRFSPDFGRQSVLSAVQALSSHNAWAVGYFCRTDCADPRNEHDLILHWNGTRWAKVASPNPGSGDSLDSVSAASASDIWAVGVYLGSSGDIDPLVLHWNGAKWRRVAFGGGARVMILTAVSARSARNAWIIGYRNHVLAEHWDGKTWRQVPLPQPKTLDYLSAIAVRSPASAWAVGQYCVAHCLSPAEVVKAQILRWNGRKWARVKLPVTDAGDLSSIDVVSATDAWAAGQAMPSPTKTTPLILHWNGKRWSRVADGPGVSPHALAFGARNDGWAMANVVSMRWNGVKWRKVSIPAPGTTDFTGVSATSASDVWAVGVFCPPNDCAAATPFFDTLAMHWNGRRWQRT